MKKVIFSIIILALIGGGFFYWWNNQADEREKKGEQEQAITCREVGNRAYEILKENVTGAVFFKQPEFTFNKELDVCLYSGGYNKSSFGIRFVKDAYTDETLLIYTFDPEKALEEKEVEKHQKYIKEYDELFNQ